MKSFLVCNPFHEAHTIILESRPSVTLEGPFGEDINGKHHNTLGELNIPILENLLPQNKGTSLHSRTSACNFPIEDGANTQLSANMFVLPNKSQLNVFASNYFKLHTPALGS